MYARQRDRSVALEAQLLWVMRLLQRRVELELGRESLCRQICLRALQASGVARSAQMRLQLRQSHALEDLSEVLYRLADQ